MSASWWGVVLGAGAGVGLLVMLAGLSSLRGPGLSERVLPYLRDLPGVRVPQRTDANQGLVAALVRPLLRRGGDWVERVLGGSASVQRRIDRAGLSITVQEFRIEQVLWGMVGFAVVAAWGLLRSLRDPSHALVSLMACLIAFAAGVMLRENHLTSQVRNRERRMVAEFPTIAELLALAVAAGESPVAALDRVVRASRGELSAELARVLAQVRTGVPVSTAFDELADRSGVGSISRFAGAVAVAVERGTPLADVLHAQAADVRESGRRDLIETAARKEVLMMVPVVFLVLPVTVLFAFYPGVIGLRLS